ncbi:MAG: phospholipase D family protein [Myxococcales bacterium]|nr:phospholipase D family protein [Myxococcales bacterium]MCB9708489.1 phospholipase D family protein [Myxococcales bacterium]
MSLHTSNVDAFAVRLLAARAAGRSLDLQYYLWHVDVTGRLLMNEVLGAADRGVRVRIILDDINAHGEDAALRTLATHPHIDVRMYNPSQNRWSDVRRGLELLFRAMSLNRRMHNKSWIADGRIAIVGGRNIGDEYFDAATTRANFVDTDLSITGPAVADASRIFDSFWNSKNVIPIGALAGEADFTLDDVRTRLVEFERSAEARPYLDHVAAVRSVDRILTGRQFWSADVQVYSDPPDKRDRGKGWLVDHVLQYLAKAQQSVEIVSPYFVPGEAGVAKMRELRERNVQVAILTNSLAATDVSAVHGAYANYRLPLLSLGVELFELMPMPGTKREFGFGSSGANLHTKAFTVDDKWGFVGSLNLDQRSVSLNTFAHYASMLDLLDEYRAFMPQFDNTAQSLSATQIIIQQFIDQRFTTPTNSGAPLSDNTTP